MKNQVSNLESFVKDWINNPENNPEDVLQYGCVSGCVSELIYYSDTLAFYEEYKEEINNLLNNIGLNMSDLNGFDEEDPLCLETNNRNLLAWFGFEETLRMLVS